MEIGSRPDLAGIGRSVQAVTALLEDEVARGLASSRIVLAGFSQGGLIALEAGARFRLPLAGIIALSTYLADPPGFPPARGGMPVFMGHGRFDDLVPHELGRQSRDELIARGYRVTWKDYAIPHSVCAEEIGDIAAWLAVLLEADDSS
jgi:phospholipase/carboxylesterase